MDNQNQQSSGTEQQPMPPVVPQPANAASSDAPLQIVQTPQLGAPSADAKPELVIPDSAAAALLALNNLQSSHRPEKQLPIKMIIALVGLIILVLFTSAALGAVKSSKKTSSSVGPDGSQVLQKQTNTGTSKDTTNQIDQDVKSCSNPLNAVSQC